jgi:hypothetical protein
MARFRHLASPQFDWRHTPEYDSDLAVDHHIAPLENGDRLHVYRFNGRTKEHWMHEISPHDLPPRHPFPKNMHSADEWDETINKPQFDRRNFDFGPFADKETAMEAVEQRYKEQAPTWGPRAPQRREVNYDNLDDFKDFL